MENTFYKKDELGFYIKGTKIWTQKSVVILSFIFLRNLISIIFITANTCFILHSYNRNLKNKYKYNYSKNKLIRHVFSPY